MDKQTLSRYFELFNEIGIIEQLSRASFEARLPKGFLQSHFSVLNHLIRVQDGRTPLELARAFQVPKTTMTHTLAGLEKHALIEMRPNPNDGRSKCVWLTEEGRQFRENSIEALSDKMASVSTSLSVEEVDQILPTLRKLRIFLDENRDS